MNFLVQVAVAIVLAVVSYLLAPKPKAPKGQEFRDIEAPTAEAGRPIPVVFGEGTIKSPNTLWYGQTRVEVIEVDA
ncbi:hypothetical protein PRZ61_12220 [Halomonas pacifica]|uniref:hypothetical protein n=1 Tax=Bisbaumannia pacifica TaxID=77098 RepID=UPI0023591E94|nr:hypothetical protein [Halomonas pacifica]MDC8804207.1 hypothetical protein [Halomonas pacifica]